MKTAVLVLWLMLAAATFEQAPTENILTISAATPSPLLLVEGTHETGGG